MCCCEEKGGAEAVVAVDLGVGHVEEVRSMYVFMVVRKYSCH
jgi:hypothetical protein